MISDNEKLTNEDITDVMRTTTTLLNKWGLSQKQKMALLCLRSSSALHRFENEPGVVKLNQDQIMRLSMLMNIHSALRVCFNNPENTYGFIDMRNDNAPFNGQRPIDVATRDIIGLSLTHNAITSMETGIWGSKPLS
jgi:hypothetical protein